MSRSFLPSKSLVRKANSTGLVLLLTIFCSCDCGQIFGPEIVTLLADLVDGQDFSKPPSITIGAVANFVAKALNEKAKGECTETSRADATNYLIRVLLKNTSGNWDEVTSRDDRVIPALNGGSKASLSDNMIFNQSGDYRLEYYLDESNQVKERDEYNNHLDEPARIDKLSALRETNNFVAKEFYVGPSSIYHAPSGSPACIILD